MGHQPNNTGMLDMETSPWHVPPIGQSWHDQSIFSVDVLLRYCFLPQSFSIFQDGRPQSAMDDFSGLLMYEVLSGHDLHDVCSVSSVYSVSAQFLQIF
jgi:hypothetical protein